MEKYNRIMEVFWLAMAIFSLLFAIWSTKELGFEESAVYYFMPVIAATLSFSRRYMRKKQEQRNQNREIKKD